MKKLLVVGAVLFTFTLGCTQTVPVTAQSTQSTKAREAAQSIHFDENAEIENIQRRLKLTSQPGLLGYILLMNDAGQPVLYTTVKGKVTSGSKRLTDPTVCQNYELMDNFSGGQQWVNHSCPSDEGTYGSSNPYIYFWDQADRYHQWSGEYLYSDQPIRLSVEPLVISIEVPVKE